MQKIVKNIFLIITTAVLQLNAAHNSLKDTVDPVHNQLLVQFWFSAAQSGDLEALQALINKVDINVQDDNYNTALILAAAAGHGHIIEYLLTCEEINISAENKNSKTVFSFPEIYSVLTSSTNKKVQLALWFDAARRSNIKTLKKLLPHIDINTRDECEYTALICAAEDGQEAAVEFLLQVPNVDVNALSQWNNTPLIVSTFHGHENIVKRLLQAPGIDINLRNKYGETALIHASAAGEENIVKLLLEHPDIDINARDRDGSALTAAADQGYETIVKLLLAVPTININALSKNGYTALQVATCNGHSAISKLLENQIAQLSRAAFEAITQKLPIKDALARLRSIHNQIGIDTIVDDKGNTPLDVACKYQLAEIIEYILILSRDPQKLLERFPFEFLNPTSTSFRYFIDLAYGTLKKRKKTAENINICARCQAADCQMRCSKCRQVYYCSDECQKANWKIHKTQCASPAS